MGHREYIESCDERQLECLVELAQAKLKTFRDAGWVTLWVVCSDEANEGWFEIDDYEGALNYLVALGKQAIQDDDQKRLFIDKIKYRPHEVGELLKICVIRK